MSIRFPIRSLIAGCLAMALPAAAADHISIAATLPLTGTESRSGLQYREGYDLAFALANAKGGLRVGGKQYLVDLRAVDDASDPAKAGSLLEAYVVRDHVNLLLSSYSTRLVESQSTVAEKHHVPLVIGGASSKSLFRRGYHYAFGLQASVEQLAFAEMRFVEEQQKAGKLPAKVRIALLWEDTAHGRDYRDSVLEYVRKTPARQAAYEIALNEGFALDQKSYRKLLDNVKAGNVDVFLADAHQADFIVMQREYRSLGLCHAIASYGARGSEKKAAQEIGPHGVAGLVSGAWWTPLVASSAEGQTFLNAFRVRYNRDPEAYEAVGYEAARALFAAIEKAGSVEPGAVRAALASLEMPSILPGGKLSFPEAKGYQAQGTFVLLQNQPDGSVASVYPRAVATREGTVRSCPAGEAAGQH